MDKHFTLEIVTPVKTVNFEEVEYLRAPSLEGLFGVMPGHVSSIINLDIGEIYLDHNINIGTKTGKIIVHKLQLVGRKSLNASDFIRGNSSLNGKNLGVR